MNPERMLVWFSEENIDDEFHGMEIIMLYKNLAHTICDKIKPGPERTVALRKLLESRDSALRAKDRPGN